MMTYDVVLFKGKKLSKNRFYVAIRTTFRGKQLHAWLDKIQEQDWETGPDQISKRRYIRISHPSHKSLNTLIVQKLAQAADLVQDFERGKGNLTHEKINKILKGERLAQTFFDFLSEYVEHYKAAKKYTEAGSIEARGKNIWKFVNKHDFPVKSTKEIKYSAQSIFKLIKTGRDLEFADITADFLRKLATFLSVDCGLGERSIYNHWLLLRTIFNRAVEAKAIDKASHYPFKEYSLSMPESQKIPLDEQDIRKFEAAEVESKTLTWVDAKNAWLFSFSFGGMRISDVLKTNWTDISKLELNYVMGKNNKPVSIKATKRVEKILKYYEEQKELNQGFIFPALRNADLTNPVDIERKLRNADRLYCKWLPKIAKAAGIAKKPKPHDARHTFGHLAGDSIPIQALQAVYRHSDITTTIKYQQHWLNNEKINDAVKKVVDF